MSPHALAQQRRTDPTRTKTTRRQFAQHLRGRWDAIKSHISQGVIQNDAFGLRRPDIGSIELADNVDKDDTLTPSPGQFDFERDAEAADAFGEWLNDAIEQEILEQYEGDRYIRQGYQRGIQHADRQLNEEGVTTPDEPIQVAIREPVHRDELELMYSRAFGELEGVTQKTAQEMRRELTEGLAAGQNPRDIGRAMNDRVEAIGKTRSTVLARTEVVRAHSASTLNRYEQIAGDIKVDLKAEWLTAGDNRVCDRCLSASSAGPYTLEKARGLIPLHPQCRCAWNPLVNN